MLRAAREKQGLHIAALAAAIKVSPRKLDALEHDRWHELPDATFTRALAQTVCRTLKIDARPVLDKLPAASAMALEPRDAGLNEPFHDRPGREQPTFAATAVRPMIWGAAVLMAAAAVVYLLPVDLWSNFSAPAVVSVPTAKPVLALPAPAVLPAAQEAAASAAAAAPAAASSVSVAPVPPNPALPPMPQMPQMPTPATESALPAPAAAPSALPVAAATPGLVQLRTSKASWIEARDGRGAMLLSRIVLPGESVGLDGNLPIRMTIGNASATQLGFRGQAVDLVPRTRDNIARVELQ